MRRTRLPRGEAPVSVSIGDVTGLRGGPVQKTVECARLPPTGRRTAGKAGKRRAKKNRVVTRFFIHSQQQSKQQSNLKITSPS
jgi:hypothetical protein